MEIFDGYQFRQAVEAFGFDTKCSISPPDWYLTVGEGTLFLNWELSKEKIIDLYLEKSRYFAIDFFVGDLNVSEIDPDLACLGSWIPFEMIDLWELAKIVELCPIWHVRYMLYVQDGPHTPQLF